MRSPGTRTRTRSPNAGQTAGCAPACSTSCRRRVVATAEYGARRATAPARLRGDRGRSRDAGTGGAPAGTLRGATRNCGRCGSTSGPAAGPADRGAGVRHRRPVCGAPRTSVKSAGRTRANSRDDAGVEAVATEYPEAMAVVQRDRPAPAKRGERISQSTFTARCLRSAGRQVGMLRWFGKERVLTWSFPNGREGSGWSRKVPGGFKFTPTMAWANVQGLAFLRQSRRSPVRGRRRPPTLGSAPRRRPVSIDTRAARALRGPRRRAHARLRRKGRRVTGLHFLDGTVFEECCTRHDLCYEAEHPSNCCEAWSWFCRTRSGTALAATSLWCDASRRLAATPGTATTGTRRGAGETRASAATLLTRAISSAPRAAPAASMTALAGRNGTITLPEGQMSLALRLSRITLATALALFLFLPCGSAQAAAQPRVFVNEIALTNQAFGTPSAWPPVGPKPIAVLRAAGPSEPVVAVTKRAAYWLDAGGQLLRHITYREGLGWLDAVRLHPAAGWTIVGTADMLGNRSASIKRPALRRGNCAFEASTRSSPTSWVTPRLNSSHATAVPCWSTTARAC